MNPSKYRPFGPVKTGARRWPGSTVTKPPVWCSVDLRDGNQALVCPMDLGEKLRFFKMLTEVGFKEIEVGFPAASKAERDALRALIDGGLVPDGVSIQVLAQAREHIIRETFGALKGAKDVIFHFYNNISPLQRRVVFGTDLGGIIKIAEDAARLVRALGDDARKDGMRLRYEYSPESFSATDTDEAILVCEAVLAALGATEEEPVILDLTSTVECCTPNIFADEVEYFINNLPSRKRAVISVHPHNDRGTGVAAAELALLAGAERIEGTLFGNGERTGNVDIAVLALNMFTQGLDPGLDFSDIARVRHLYESCTGMLVHERHPYAGDLVFTAFSGSHQDAINKGLAYMREHGAKLWEIPYLPIDPADVGRSYEPIIRINSQSGKGGAAFIMERDFGYKLPKAMHAEFGRIVQLETDRAGGEISPQRVFELFNGEYINCQYPYRLIKHTFAERTDDEGHSHVRFDGTLSHKETVFEVSGEGNGPIDAFFNAIRGQKMDRFTFVDYSEHAISDGSDSKAVAYIHLRSQTGRDVFGVGISHNINLAPLRGIISAINRTCAPREGG